MANKRTFTQEFKEDAASLVIDQGYSIKEACQAVDVGASAMRRWVDQLRSERAGVTPNKGKALTPEHQEIQALRARVKQLELEKDILKKASALLMSDSMKSPK